MRKTMTTVVTGAATLALAACALAGTGHAHAAGASPLDGGRPLLPRAKSTAQQAMTAARSAAPGGVNVIDRRRASGGAATDAAASGFTARVTNPYFPLLKGMRWEYRGIKDGRRMRDVVRVTGEVRRIDGVPCAVVDDRAWLDGRLAERTTDWYTQDRHGTVWYYGERTAELDRHGHVTSREGSWRAGANGARAGIFMPARPQRGRVVRPGALRRARRGPLPRGDSPTRP